MRPEPSRVLRDHISTRAAVAVAVAALTSGNMLFFAVGAAALVLPSLPSPSRSTLSIRCAVVEAPPPAGFEWSTVIGVEGVVAPAAAAAPTSALSVAQACKFYAANPGIDEAEKTAFLKSNGVSDFVIAQASCAATGEEHTVHGHPAAPAAKSDTQAEATATGQKSEMSSYYEGGERVVPLADRQRLQTGSKALGMN